MKAIGAFIFAIYDFFVGDWRLFVGAFVTVGLVLILLYLPALEVLKPIVGLVFALGVLLTLIATVLAYRTKK